jgi:hypothetical protein
MIEPPMVRITGQRRPDRGTIERSGAHRDYRMSTIFGLSFDLEGGVLFLRRRAPIPPLFMFA